MLPCRIFFEGFDAKKIATKLVNHPKYSNTVESDKSGQADYGTKVHNEINNGSKKIETQRH